MYKCAQKEKPNRAKLKIIPEQKQMFFEAN